ncbi:MAG: type IV toxin-antitoxin system AbiEi family antitoxin domain-containing protein [Nitrospira sp.]|nr:type IV toxin-antitoxin system AbiEi family antitoxin domain-containing protein [Nitrospira sp.]
MLGSGCLAQLSVLCDSVSGSTGLTGAMDTVMVLDKADRLVTLYGRGRDVEEVDIALSFDAVSCRWTKVGDPDSLKRSVQRNAVIDLLSANPSGMAPEDVAAALDLTNDQARQLLRRMADDGDIEKLAHGVYAPAVSQLFVCLRA